MVGGLQASGFLNIVANGIDNLAGADPFQRILIFMWSAAIATIFLNAGPATALFAPIAYKLNPNQGGMLVWWALSLGVCAGSSATLTGATAGSIASSALDKFLEENPRMRQFMDGKKRFGFKEFASWGIPNMFIFLVLSSVYIGLLYYN